MVKLILSAAILISGIYFFWNSRYPPGMLAPDPPLQYDIDRSDSRSFKYKQYTLTPLAAYTLRTLVLSKQEYQSGKEAELCPLDLALGWGPMSDKRLVRRFDIVQNARFYYYNWKGNPPIPGNEIAANSANVHVIPSTEEIERRLKSVDSGDIITLDGYLISAEDDNGWRWQSSLTRTDSGLGACELMWVKSLFIH